MGCHARYFTNRPASEDAGFYCVVARGLLRPLFSLAISRGDLGESSMQWACHHDATDSEGGARGQRWLLQTINPRLYVIFNLSMYTSLGN